LPLERLADDHGDALDLVLEVALGVPVVGEGLGEAVLVADVAAGCAPTSVRSAARGKHRRQHSRFGRSARLNWSSPGAITWLTGIRGTVRPSPERFETTMTHELALRDDADSLESLLAVLDQDVDDDVEEDRPGWTTAIPSDQRPRLLLLLTPAASGAIYTHVVNGYFQPVLHTRARSAFLTGTEPVVAELRTYVDLHSADGDYHPLTFEEACDIDAILARCPLTEGLSLDRSKPNIPMAGWMYVTFRGTPRPGTWLAEKGPRSDGGQWPEFYILAWEPRP
jgi:hypothetical protein